MKYTNPSFTVEKKQKSVMKQAGQFDQTVSQQAGELPQHFLQVELQYQAEIIVRDQQKDCVLGYN